MISLLPTLLLMTEKTKPTLEQLLLEHRLLKPTQLDHIKRVAQEEDKKIEEVIREEKLVYPEPLAQLKAESLGVPYVDLSTIQSDDRAMSGISTKAAQTYRFFAFAQKEKRLLIAMESPDDYEALSAIRFIAKKKNLLPEIYCASHDGITQALNFPDTSSNTEQMLREFGQELKKTKNISPEPNKLNSVLTDTPVNKIVAVIVRHAIDGLATDIHIEPELEQLRVRYRIDGQLHTSLLLPMDLHAAVLSRVKMLANIRVTKSDTPQEGSIYLANEPKPLTVQVLIMPTTRGEKITLRMMRVSQKSPSLSDLGVAPRHQNILSNSIANPHGLILTSGPQSSGKTSLLYSLVSLLNKPSVNIASLEDPVSYEIPGVSQTQIQPERGFDYPKALHEIYRQDTDIIMIDEINDSPVAHLTIKGALSGYLIISSLPSVSNALDIITHLTGLGVNPYLVSSSLRLLIAQRLLPRLCPDCREEVIVPPKAQETIKKILKNIPPDYYESMNISNKIKLFESKGCPKCQERKTNGQVIILEAIPVFHELRQAITDRAPYDKMVELTKKQGHISLLQDGILKVLQGTVRYQDVMRVSKNTNQ